MYFEQPILQIYKTKFEIIAKKNGQISVIMGGFKHISLK